MPAYGHTPSYLCGTLHHSAHSILHPKHSPFPLALTLCPHLFCPPHSLTPQNGLQWMGVMTLGITMLLFTINFPMWGGMLTGPKPGVTEEDYYLREWSAEEVSAGLHNPSMKFAMESKSQRGFKARVPTASSIEVAVKPDAAA